VAVVLLPDLAMKDGRIFVSLDFVYTPVADVDAALPGWVDGLGAELVWKIRSEGTAVACLRMAGDGPLVLLTDHLEGETPILVYRVEDYAASVARLREHVELRELEIPHGPCASFRVAGGQRVAVYELTRPHMAEHFDGRFDD
jgi:hypothetical protein